MAPGNSDGSGVGPLRVDPGSKRERLRVGWAGEEEVPKPPRFLRGGSSNMIERMMK